MHVDPELLGLIALGEDVGTPDERAHARTCPQCAAELAELSRLVVLGRSIDDEVQLLTPSPQLWDRIRGELGLPGDEPVRPSFGTADDLAAHARLVPVAGSWAGASGEAELATDERGRRLMQVTLRADLPASGIRHAWLVHRDNPDLKQSLGVLDGPNGLWSVAHEIDLEQFSILDISQQEIGDTDHSGHTIVRGELVLAS